MRFSKYLLLMTVSLPVASHAQTSQTFHFGEGQSTLQPGHATHSEPSRSAADSAQRQPEARSKSKSRHRQYHRRRTTSHAPLQDPYSRP